MSRHRNRHRGDEHLTIPERKAKFLKHFRTYLVMSLFFILLNAFGGSDHFWAIYPILGWGIGVLMEYTSLYGPLRDKEDDHYEEFDLNDRPADRVELKDLERRPLYQDKDLV